MVGYSQDLRDRVISACERGECPSVIARRLEVSDSWVRQVYKRFKESGERTAHRVGGYRVSRLVSWEIEIKGWIAEKQDMTLAEMVERLADKGVQIAISSLWEQLDHWGLTFKKKPTRPRTSPNRYPGATR